MKPAVSVILPSLNVKSYIGECINSVLKQTLKELEIICIDAGSTDGTKEILQKYADIDSRVKLLHSEIKSYGYQLNMGLDVAKGKYIGIVETDDFVVSDMYETLYNCAEKENVDYVKADYKSFFTLLSGERLFSEEHLFQSKNDYETVVKPQNIIDVLERDHSIWKGIYNKDFLTSNSIRFHETPGAAFQDIGFSMQVMYHAKRAVYLQKCCYCYCMDRDGASSNTKNVLKYSFQEFRWLLEENVLSNHLTERYAKGFYRRMSYSFLRQYVKISQMNNYTKLNEWDEYYDWFKEKLNKAIHQGILSKDDYSEETWFLLSSLLESSNNFIEYLKNRDKRVSLNKDLFLRGIQNSMGLL